MPFFTTRSFYKSLLFLHKTRHHRRQSSVTFPTFSPSSFQPEASKPLSPIIFTQAPIEASLSFVYPPPVEEDMGIIFKMEEVTWPMKLGDEVVLEDIGTGVLAEITRRNGDYMLGIFTEIKQNKIEPYYSVLRAIWIPLGFLYLD